MKRGLWLGVLAAAALALAYFWVRRPDDEAQIRAQLTRLAAAVSKTDANANPLFRGARMRSEFAAVLDEDVRVNIPEVASALPNKPGDLADTATQFTLLYPSLDVTLGDLETKLHDERQSAHVAATASLSAVARDGHPERDNRALNFLLRKADGTWRVTSVTVWTKGDDTRSEEHTSELQSQSNLVC